MSLILEALKKSEANRRLGEAPGLATPFATPRRRRSALPILSVLIVAAAAGGWWLLRTPPGGTAHAPAGAAPSNLTSAPRTNGQAAAPLPPSVPVVAHPAPPRPAPPAEPSVAANAAAENAAAHPGVPQIAPGANTHGPDGAESGFVAVPPRTRAATLAAQNAAAAAPPRPAPAPLVTVQAPPPPKAAPAPAVTAPTSSVASNTAATSPAPPPPPVATAAAPVAAAPALAMGKSAPAPAVASAPTPTPPPASAAAPLPAGNVAPAPTAAAAPNETPGFVATSRRGAPPPPDDGKPHVAPPSDPTFDALPFATRKEIPALKLAMHVYAPNPADRFILINGSRLVEGDKQDDLAVHEIRPDGVVLEYKGTRFFFPRDGY